MVLNKSHLELDLVNKLEILLQGTLFLECIFASDTANCKPGMYCLHLNFTSPFHNMNSLLTTNKNKFYVNKKTVIVTTDYSSKEYFVVLITLE